MNNTEFNAKYNSIVEKAFFYSGTTLREGLLAAYEFIDEKKCLQRDIFEYGMRLVLDGTESRIVDKVLTNIINLEADNDEKTLMNIQKEAVLSIQNGDNPYILMVILSSFVNIGIGDIEKIYKDTMEKFNVNMETKDSYRISAEQVDEGISIFEDIVLLDDESTRLVLDGIEDVELSKALKQVDYEIVQYVFRKIPEERMNNIKKIMSEIKWKEVEDAKRKIVKHIRNYFGVDKEKGDIK